MARSSGETRLEDAKPKMCRRGMPFPRESPYSRASIDDGSFPDDDWLVCGATQSASSEIQLRKEAGYVGTAGLSFRLPLNRDQRPSLHVESRAELVD